MGTLALVGLEASMEDRTLKVSAGRRSSKRTNGWLMVLLLWAPSCVGRSTLFTSVPVAGVDGARSLSDTGGTSTDSGHSDGGVTGTGGPNEGGAGMRGAGTSGGALRLDGIDDYVALAAARGGASEKEFSSELWFRTTAPTGMLLEVYASRGGVDDGGADRQSYLKNGQVCFYVFTSECDSDRALCSVLCTREQSYNDGAWHHVAGTVGPAGQHLYVDGKLILSAPAVTSSVFSTDTGFQVGRGAIGPWGPIGYYAGDIDDVRVWSVQRTAGEIATNRGIAIEPTTPGLQGYWRFDESGSASTAADATGAGNQGRLVGFLFTPSPWLASGAL